MKLISLLPVILALLLITACSTSGTKIQRDKLATIQKGVTTEQEILATFGKPDSITTTPDRKVLAYTYQENNSMQRNVVATTGSLVGGMVAGSLGSVAGSLAGSSAVPSQVDVEILTVEVDKQTNKVLNYQFQQTQ